MINSAFLLLAYMMPYLLIHSFTSPHNFRTKHLQVYSTQKIVPKLIETEYFFKVMIHNLRVGRNYHS